MTIEAVDLAIMRLSRSQGPAGLVNIERFVLDRLASEAPQRNRDSLGLSSLAAAVGLVIGVAGGAIPSEAPSKEAILSPLTDYSAFPNSTLLMESR